MSDVTQRDIDRASARESLRTPWHHCCLAEWALMYAAGAMLDVSASVRVTAQLAPASKPAPTTLWPHMHVKTQYQDVQC